MAKPRPQKPTDGDSAAPTPADVPTASPGVLYLVATPIGNLEDVTARALRILREADVIAAEDTRVTRKLLAHFDIHTPLTSYHAHTSAGKESSLLERLRAGERIALVSDAGTPGISDPGESLAAAAVDAGVRVEPIPGPNAVLSALIASGLPTGRFVFEGFLPRTKPDRRERLHAAAREPRTIVFYEAPPRIVELLKDLIAVCGPDRRVVLARELTKRFEEFVRGTLAEALDHFTRNAPRGEFVVVLEGAPAVSSEGDDGPDTEALLRDAFARGLSPRDAAKELVEKTGMPRNQAYALALTLRT